MDHVAIMKRSWGLTQKILSGQKRIESRWYLSKHMPWDRIREGDMVYFKDSGDAIRIKASVEKVMQFSDMTPEKVSSILKEYGEMDGIEKDRTPFFFDLFKNKKYCILVFLRDAEQVEPFDIDKTGFGSMSAWVSTDDIKNIMKPVV